MQEYEFSKEEVCQYISQGIIKLKFEELIKNPEMFFDDIKDIVCLMVEEGTKYKFAHRSFQTYFAAYYMVAHITDEQQKIFMGKELRRQFGMKADFFFTSSLITGGLKQNPHVFYIILYPINLQTLVFSHYYLPVFSLIQ